MIYKLDILKVLIIENSQDYLIIININSMKYFIHPIPINDNARKDPTKIPNVKGIDIIYPAVSLSSSLTYWGANDILADVAQPLVKAKKPILIMQKRSDLISGSYTLG